MKRLHAGALLFAVGFIGCGGSSGNKCGDGTEEIDGECVATPVSCAAGTVLDEDECVPDGTVVCTGATVYDADLGVCVVSDDACGEGTVLVDGACVPFDDTLVGDTGEGDEPNDVAFDGSTLATFEVPDIGADAVTVEGCIVPADFDDDELLDADRDSYELAVTAPTLLTITVDGVGGLSAAFEVTSADESLAGDGWLRQGLNVTSDGASRQVFLPVAGTYYISVADGRSLLSGAIAGGEDACYLLQVEQTALPEATVLAEASTSGTVSGAPVFLTVTAAEGDLFSPTLSTTSSAAAPALLAFVDDVYASSSTPTGLDAASLAMAELGGGEVVTFVLDTAWNYAIEEVEYSFATGLVAIAEIPDGGGDLTIAQRGGAPTAILVAGAAGSVAHLELEVEAEGPALAVTIIDPDGTTVSTPCFSDADSFAGCTSLDAWFPTSSTGTYRVEISDPASSDSEFVVAADATIDTPAELTLDAGEDVSLAAPRQFFSFAGDLTEWLELTVSAFENMDDLRLAIYDASATGVFDRDIVPLVEHLLIQDGATGYLTGGDADRTYLVSIGDPGERLGTEACVLTPSTRAHTDLGDVTEGAPIGPTTYDFDAEEEQRFFLSGTVGTVVTVTATPVTSENAQIRVLNPDETSETVVNENWDGSAETLELTLSGATLVLVVDIADAEAGSLSVEITAVDPAYSIEAGTQTYVDACASGTSLLTDGLDELTAVQSLGSLGFEFFGVVVTDVIISSNGWLTFDSAYDGEAYFFEPGVDDLNNVVAPFTGLWDGVEVCVDSTSTTYTVQWEGTMLDLDTEERFVVQTQVILHDDNIIDVRFGPDHDGSSSLGAAPTVEDATGDTYLQSPFATLAGTSVTFE